MVGKFMNLNFLLLSLLTIIISSVFQLSYANSSDAVLFAENVNNNETAFLAVPVNSALEGKEYRIVELLNGEYKAQTISLPQPMFLISNSDTLLIFLSEDLKKNAKLNSLRSTQNLPLIKARQGQIFNYANLRDTDFREFITCSGGEVEANIEYLNQNKSRYNTDWDIAVYEGLLWRNLVQKWEKMEEGEGAKEAYDYAQKDFSNELKVAFSRYLLNHPNNDLLPVIRENIYKSDPYQTGFYIVLLSAWNDSLSINLIYESLAYIVNNNIVPSPSFSSNIVSELQEKKLDTVNAGSVVQLYTSIRSQLENPGYIPEVNSLSDFMNYSSLLSDTSAASIFRKIAEILSSQPVRFSKQEVKLLEQPMISLSLKCAEKAVYPLGLLMNTRDLRRMGFAGLIIESLAAANCDESVETLIEYIESGIHQRRGLIKLSQIKNVKALDYAWKWVKADLDSMISLGNQADQSIITEIKSGGALNNLAERHAEIPEIEDTLIKFYHGTSPDLKQYAYDILVLLATDSAAVIVLQDVVNVDEKNFPTRLRHFRRLPSLYKVPFMLEVLKGNVKLPAWSKRQEDYKSSALEEIVEDSSEYCLEALEYLALNMQGREAHVAISELLERNPKTDPKIIAWGAFGPHQPWRSESVALVLNDNNLSKKLKSKIVKTAAKILKKNRDYYTIQQLRTMAQVLTERVEPSDVKSLLKVLAREDDLEVKAWANYGLQRIKEHI